MDNAFIASLQQQLQQANEEIQRLQASQVPSTPVPPPYPAQHLRPPLRPQFNNSVPLPHNQQNFVRPSMPQSPPRFIFGSFNNISQQILIPGHLPTAASSTVHTTIPPNTGASSGFIPTIPVTTEDPLNVRLKSLEEHNQKLFALLTKLTGAAVPVEVEPKTGFQASPFVDEIALVDVPKKYSIPAFATKYSGVTDSVEHVAQYKQLMWAVPIPTQYQEFASSRKMEKQTSNLYYVVQKPGEIIRDNFNRFNAAMIEIKNCDVKTAIEAYKRGLEDSSGLYLELTKYPLENFDDVRARTLAFMRIEDDALFRRKNSIEKKPISAHKHDFKHKRVNNIGNPRHESKTRPSKGTVKLRYPELSTYDFAGTSKELVDSLRKIDANVRWPKKSDKPSKDKDQNRWCDFHEDHGYTTDECISLKKEISYLKSKGHLKGIISDEQGRPASPVHTKVINCITGGSEVCGLTYSTAKRHARDGPHERPIPDEVKSKAEKELDAMTITFDKDDTQGVHHKHHDALVIQLTIGNYTLKVMGIERSEIIQRNTTLIGFNGDPMNTLGEIILPIFAKGINKQTKFNVIDCQSAYNVILGRPWIHEMKAVPSTYHQKIKFPSPWGIQEIASEKKEHSDCFAWSHEDMVGIDPSVISHKLNVDPTFKPIKQRRRKFAPERNKVINDEVDNPLKTVLRKPELTGHLAKWSIYLSGFDIKFKSKTAIKSQALADFVAEFSPGLEPTTCDEIVTIQDNQPWLLYVDGSSNVRGAGLGIVLKSSQGGNIVYSIRCEFKATNNEAEYEALIAGLDIAHKLRAKHLDVRSDSLLVVNQINGDFQAKDSKMMSYLKIVKERIVRFDHFSIEQIPRDQNTQADALANLGYAFNDPFLKNIHVLHLITPAIEIKEEIQMNEETYNWSLDIWNYLKHDKLPEHKLEARKTRSKASRYTIFEDQLYRKSTSGLLLRCVVSQAQMNQILQEMHDGECGNHAGGRSLANRISRQGYYWPTLREDAIRYVQRCDACQKHSEAGAFSQVRDKEVISFIQNNIIYRFRVPSEIMCDNGSQFISDKTRTFCEKRGIKLVTSTPRYPQSNGLAESSNKVIIKLIRKRLKRASSEVRQHLLQAPGSSTTKPPPSRLSPDEPRAAPSPNPSYDRGISSAFPAVRLGNVR
ncbi:hypothetical protein OSB04_023847 [Centaurea solstitialis]|uniref:Uncharacterized protein n=1 Tax=Centaurea solstitialis TaxID=347529 RepID=A0AA38SJZ6_9ASTR|nr:hypothetical protein OSB04_023847 [Centaurea solstitialis]